MDRRTSLWYVATPLVLGFVLLANLVACDGAPLKTNRSLTAPPPAPRTDTVGITAPSADASTSGPNLHASSTCSGQPSGWIWFRTVREDSNGDGQVDRGDRLAWYKVRADGSDLQATGTSPANYDVFASPNGQWRVTPTGGTLTFSRLDNAARYTVSLALDRIESVSWSPDSLHLAVGGRREADGESALAIYRVSREGQVVLLLQTRFDFGEWPSSRLIIDDMHWSRSNSRIFFTSPYRLLGETSPYDGDGVLPSELYSVDPGSGALARYDTRGIVCCPRWSPDDSTALYLRWDGLFWAVWLIDGDGRNPRPLGDGRFYIEPSPAPAMWSPDGCWIVFASAWDIGLEQWLPESELFLVRTDGTDVRRLTDDTFPDRWPVWLP